ncbi:GHMP kinase OS=Tsukamurella paurometabola (strain ATCC 8368 / DSM / CCUG 35730 / CIP 100753/ JCM 10117 / KCTC 9821 / NBRC 16120 / NCIMB 702349 / NCTC 13040)OX=521096 GN=Tpau_3721 PE=4 SV=1 [Tsukamurella paurometabola]|uniref:GHMP kinase n=1 Tax=Tsukamurella paurometabola (strain ATCC 8368 / DSM 20162 / CCUG 35730 / CIP 100753 / JCM 10117 / KCTC 9821 / NBRC 16120 / NCIMB 702349 / NCTC 13040) TaxID=521096 RepID=D5UYJ6_TSUPD|nr:GHMP kinase [Tsukamurella paurometabola]ADG80299.1 GHMP kinase [Tsukamurella paurometabola DSM 20162]SUP39182.1 homoserine kinase [Tsukamurella paurometabola]
MAGARGRGVGRSTGHHGEFLQGRFHCTAIGECPGLVTVPVRSLTSVAEFVPDHTGAVRAHCAPGGTRRLHKARAAARATIAHLRERGEIRFTGGELRIDRTIPVGMGLGSSTADVLAAARAVADAADVELDTQALALLSVAAEGASDPLWSDRPVLFAHRHGHVIEDLGEALPAMLLVHCRLGGPVDTLDLPLAGAAGITVYEELREELRAAVRAGDARGVGAVATRSARLNQSRHYKPGLETLIAVADSGGALGVQVAHSGNVAGVLFPHTHSSEGLRRTRIRAAEQGLRLGPRPVPIGGAA